MYWASFTYVLPNIVLATIIKKTYMEKQKVKERNEMLKGAKSEQT